MGFITHAFGPEIADARVGLLIMLGTVSGPFSVLI